MKRFFGIGVAAVMVAVMIFSVYAAPVSAADKKAKSAAEVMTVKGTVVELAKDAKGKVTSVGIKTDAEEYVVDGKIAGLVNDVGKMVEAKGTVLTVKDKKHLKVASFKVAE
jgi:hypothetical protein